MQRRNRSRVVNNSFEIGGQIHHLTQPVQNDFFQFGRSGRGAPEHRFHIERGGEHFAENADRRSRSRKKPVKIRVIPVRHGGQDKFFHIFENLWKTFAGRGRRFRQSVFQIVRRVL